MKIGIVILCCGIVLHANAQDFKWKTELENPKREGFHQVLLTPEISGRMRSDFADIRLFDAANQQVPYVLRTEVPLSNAEIFREYRILSKTSRKGCCTELIIHNQNGNNINNISLLIRNSDVQKSFKLSGSDDRKNWYVIKDNYRFNSMYSTTSTSEIRLVDFPLSNYVYYKIEIDDSLSGPLNVISAGFYDNYVELGKYSEVSGGVLSQRDSSEVKRSYILLEFPENRYLDKLEVEIEGPQYYLRSACFAVVPDQEGTEPACYRDFDLSSNGNNVVDLERLAGKRFYLIVENDDNPPLRIKAIKTWQLNTYLTANLEKSGKYHLCFGSEKMEAPEYDLKYFESNIPENVPSLKSGALLSLQDGMVLEEEKPKEENAWLIWSAILVVVVFLTYISVKMIRDMKNE